MKKLFFLLISVLLFSSFSNAYFMEENPQNINFAEEAPETITINKAILENLTLELAKLKQEIANPEPARYMKVPFPQRPQTNLQQATYVSKAILNQIESIFKFTIDKADKLTSKKSIIAFFVLAGPFIVLYHQCFGNIDLVQNLIRYLFYGWSDATASVVMKAGEGAGKGIINAAIENPIITAEVVGGAGLLYTGGVMFTAAVKKMADDAAPHISSAAGWCLRLLPVLAVGIRNQVVPNFNYGIAI